jgi:hypothetical protein
VKDYILKLSLVKVLMKAGTLASTLCIGEYVVIPAHNRGAAPARFRLEGTRRPKCCLTTILSE